MINIESLTMKRSYSTSFQMLWLAIVSLLLLGCTNKIPTTEERKHTIDTLKSSASVETAYSSSRFELFAIEHIPRSCKDRNLHLYVEGDGLSWVSRSRRSHDPTPINPLAFKLMLQDPETCKVYLARPCQYIRSKICKKKYWSSHRFSKEVIESYLEVMEQIKKKYRIRSFTLIGYSGGGAVAALIAAQREDVSELITVAGNLDHHKWTSLHGVSALNESLNPPDFSHRLKNIPQYHLIGTKDAIIPEAIFQAYKSRFQKRSQIHAGYYPATHHTGWENAFSNFLTSR